MRSKKVLPMKLELPDSVYSTQDVTNLILEIHSYTSWFSRNSILKRVSNKKSKRQSDEPTLSPAASETIRTWSSKNGLTQSSLAKLIKSLERSRSEARVVTITLAAAAPNDIKKKLVAWCRQNIASDVMVSFNFSSTILGGMVMRFGSRIYDWSFKRQILAASDKFPEVIRRV
jgi:hypothetical protein